MSTIMPQNDPVVFTARGLRLDTRLNVLRQEFHCHSAILKLKSNFFFKFMDSPDKVLNNEGPFKYEWVSSIDDDGTWGLVAADPSKDKLLASWTLKGDTNDEIKAFMNLLYAMYCATVPDEDLP
ncbi:uncharacterized protein LY89DRAFT_727496 [Mollisia scopiformis]|uniref:BTB domain-containing protein n=1 Tax=Mollisia scopiformis TaxID=149040 RepID=A0A194XVY4_MOLSC|nr:uncharacterized protein LY89DRAFT_727496 [Mollisia scopiformis]KUJ24470.1 hypothetical protein LY89DRAFT_727496 [Mollisia scopiformis]